MQLGNDLSNPSSTVLANEEKATHYLCVFMLPTATLLGLLLPKGGLWIFKMCDSLSACCAHKCMAGSDKSARVLEELRKHPSPCLIQEWYSGHVSQPVSNYCHLHKTVMLLVKIIAAQTFGAMVTV